MAGTTGELPGGARITYYTSLGVVAKSFPRETVEPVLEDTRRDSQFELLVWPGQQIEVRHLFSNPLGNIISPVTCWLLGSYSVSRSSSSNCRRYRKHRDALFAFLHRPDVPADNNGSERALRKSAVHRKVSGSFRSVWGAQAFAVFAPVLPTAPKQRHDMLTTLTEPS